MEIHWESLLPCLWRKLGFPIASCYRTWLGLVPVRVHSDNYRPRPLHYEVRSRAQLVSSLPLWGHGCYFSTSIGSWYNNKIYTFMVLFSRLCWRFFRKSQGRCNHRIICTSQLKSNNAINYIGYSRSPVMKRKQTCYLNWSRLWQQWTTSRLWQQWATSCHQRCCYSWLACHVWWLRRL